MRTVLAPISAIALAFGLAVFCGPAFAQTDSTVFYHVADSARHGPLISCATAMETAWDLVRDPFTDSVSGDAERAALVRKGFSVFTQTKKYAPEFTGNDLACGHCHVNAGQREKALPLVGVAHVFPEYNKRAGREFSLADRITGCFLRSMNGTASPAMLAAHGTAADTIEADATGAAAGTNAADPERAASVIRGSEEVRALEAYIDWLSEGFPAGTKLPWRGLNLIPDSGLVPVGELDSSRGRALYEEKCVTCHAGDGRGIEIGDIKAGPLWGPASWNDGAGAARVYTLAGMIRHMMPYVDPGSLTDGEALQIAFFICSQPRPAFPFKESDYTKGKVPPDAVYYRPVK
jgi:thiosulfate dehydrogenase